MLLVSFVYLPLYFSTVADYLSFDTQAIMLVHGKEQTNKNRAHVKARTSNRADDSRFAEGGARVAAPAAPSLFI